MIPVQPFAPSDFAASYATNVISSLPSSPVITKAAEVRLSSPILNDNNSNNIFYMSIGIAVFTGLVIGSVSSLIRITNYRKLFFLKTIPMKK